MSEKWSSHFYYYWFSITMSIQWLKREYKRERGRDERDFLSLSLSPSIIFCLSYINTHEWVWSDRKCFPIRSITNSYKYFILRQLRRKWLLILPSQRLMFNRSTAESRICRGRKTGVPGEKPSESDWDRQISSHVRTRSLVVEVGGATDNHYANLTPHASIKCEITTIDYCSITVVKKNNVLPNKVQICSGSESCGVLILARIK